LGTAEVLALENAAEIQFYNSFSWPRLSSDSHGLRCFDSSLACDLLLFAF
jgi:hypothetical protein